MRAALPRKETAHSLRGAMNSMLTSLVSPMPFWSAHSSQIRLASPSKHGEPDSKYRRPLEVTPTPVPLSKDWIALLTRFSLFSTQYPTICRWPDLVSRTRQRSSVMSGCTSTGAMVLKGMMCSAIEIANARSLSQPTLFGKKRMRVFQS
jgi:hypothetical protein